MRRSGERLIRLTRFRRRRRWTAEIRALRRSLTSDDTAPTRLVRSPAGEMCSLRLRVQPKNGVPVAGEAVSVCPTAQYKRLTMIGVLGRVDCKDHFAPITTCKRLNQSADLRAQSAPTPPLRYPVPSRLARPSDSSCSESPKPVVSGRARPVAISTFTRRGAVMQVLSNNIAIGVSRAHRTGPGIREVIGALPISQHVRLPSQSAGHSGQRHVQTGW